MVDKILKTFQFFGKKLVYKDFWVTDYESAIGFEKFKMADLIWRKKF